MNLDIQQHIDQASKVIGTTWPLYSFVASNQLSGFENKSFMSALKEVNTLYNATVLPSGSTFQQALETGEICRETLSLLLKENGFDKEIEEYFELLHSDAKKQLSNSYAVVDNLMIKWLSSFLDEGQAEWEMPYKSEGFYFAWRLLAIYDDELGVLKLKDIPKTSDEALKSVLVDYPEAEYNSIFQNQLAALPGWVGYIKYRNDNATQWSIEFPLSIKDYLAVRLWICKRLNISIKREDKSQNSLDENIQLKYLWLEAWETSLQKKLVDEILSKNSAEQTTKETKVVDAQMVFCIDTRSELIRRHVEANGNYETFGYAGFFGIAMDYLDPKDNIVRKACPPIVNSAYTACEVVREGNNEAHKDFKKKKKYAKFSNHFLKRMKNMLPSAFGFVEGSGLVYGFKIVKRSLFSKFEYQYSLKENNSVESIFKPELTKNDIDIAISIDEKVAIVKSAFMLMGWEQFAPIVLFVGHGSHSANNPFSSSLDCGACAASPGRHNARMLASLANSKEVRKQLAAQHQILIPDYTIFIGAEHNTTTDEILLFDANTPSFYSEALKRIKNNLKQAQLDAISERLESEKASLSEVFNRASNWSITRPEWGLARNAAFVVGSRELTVNSNLESRSFLHSYNWKLDTSGKALEGIMQGPMVVTQWINNHYYFSSVDNQRFGGGTKITHNVTGKFGVVQGNGGDLKMGLPIQSLYSNDAQIYHKPLRLSVIIHAPINRIQDILNRNSNLKNLLDNKWIYLMILDPTQNNQLYKYKGLDKWELDFKEEISISKEEIQTVEAFC